MFPDSLHVGPIAVHWFGLFFSLAILGGLIVASREFVRRGLGDEAAIMAVLAAAIGGFAGARLWVLIGSWSDVVQDPGRAILSGGGLAWYGGLLGGVVAVSVVLRVRHITWLVGADAMAPAIVLGQAIGRIGCQVSGDGDWGTVTTLPWGMAYPYAVVGWDKAPGVRVHPTPLYECAAYLAIFLLLTWRGRAERPTGTQFGLYLALAGLARFLVEFVRVNPRVLLGLTSAQWMSLASLVVGIAILANRARAPRPSA